MRRADRSAPKGATGRLPYTPVKLRYDSAETVDAGHYLRTATGTAYLVQRARRGRTGLWNLACVRWPEAEIELDATVHPLVWWPRARRVRRTSARLLSHAGDMLVPGFDDREQALAEAPLSQRLRQSHMRALAPLGERGAPADLGEKQPRGMLSVPSRN